MGDLDLGGIDIGSDPLDTVPAGSAPDGVDAFAPRLVPVAIGQRLAEHELEIGQLMIQKTLRTMLYCPVAERSRETHTDHHPSDAGEPGVG
jgi:hypothetical protein